MKLTWFGHSGFRLEISDQVLLIDPWLSNPLFEGQSREEAIAGATAVLISHGHFDHSSDVSSICKETGAPLYGTYDLVEWLKSRDGIECVGFNKGGTVKIGKVSVTLVAASHSSSLNGDNGPIYAGTEAGFMIEAEGRTVYFSGDTDVMADMEIFQALHEPQIGILSCGGHFTMDMRRAAYAAKRYFKFQTIIPCHYRTLSILEQSAERLARELPGTQVIEPQVMNPIEL